MRSVKPVLHDLVGRRGARKGAEDEFSKKGN